MSNQLLQTFILVCSTVLLRAQAPGSLADSCLLSSPAFFMKAAAKADRLNERLGSQADKIIRQLKKREGRIQKKLERIDPKKANEIFFDAAQKYKELEERLTGRLSVKHYIPVLDTLLTTLKFFDKNRKSIPGVEIEQIIDKTNALEDKFGKAGEIQLFLEERKQFLGDRISQFGLTKDIKKISKQAYYFGEKLTECRAALNDPGKGVSKAIEILSKNKAFREFLRKNSLLASFFPMPVDPGAQLPQANLTGLQTREQLNNIIQERISDVNARGVFQQNLQEAQTRIEEWKCKILEYGKNNSNEIIPGDFKPNSQKTKTFLQRIDFGVIVQTKNPRGFLPATSDLGLSLGYKLNDRSIVGIGATYKLGLGNSWNHLRITGEGMSLRSFIDWKLKGNLWLTGGYETNYQTAFDSLSRLKNISTWQRSGLIGISKLIASRKKILKKTKLQFLWDFLSYKHLPRSQPVFIRVAYNLN